MKSIETKISEIRSSIGLFRIKSHEVAEALPHLKALFEVEKSQVARLSSFSIGDPEVNSFLAQMGEQRKHQAMAHQNFNTLVDEVIDLLRAIEKDAQELCVLAQDSIAPDEFASFFTDLLDTFVALIHSSPSQITTGVH